MKCFLIIILVLGCLVPTTAPAARKSKADQEREQKAKERGEARKKQQHEERLKTDPQFFFDQKVKDKYALIEGKLVRLVFVSGDVVQVIDGTRILLSQKKPVYRTGVMSAAQMMNAMNSPTYVPAEPISVTMASTQGLTDRQTLRLRVVETGTYRYTAVIGAEKTVKAFKVTDHPITLHQYLALWKAGKGTLPDPQQ